MGWKRRAFLEQREAELTTELEAAADGGAASEAGEDDEGEEISAEQLMQMFFSEETSNGEDLKQEQAVDGWHNARRKWNNDVLFAPLPGQKQP